MVPIGYLGIRTGKGEKTLGCEAGQADEDEALAKDPAKP